MKPEMRMEKPKSIDAEQLEVMPDAPDGSRYFKIIRSTCGFIFRLYFRIEFQGFENVPKRGPFIVAPNHQSYLDPFWVSVPFPYPLRYMTWDRFVYMPVIGHFIRTLGAFPVKLESGDRGAMRHSLAHLQQGGRLMIFPEGGRTRTGEVMPFKPGVIRLAYDAKVPIVPVSVVGGYKAYNPHHWIPRPRKVKIIFHPPMTLPTCVEKDEFKQWTMTQAACLQAKVESAFNAHS